MSWNTEKTVSFDFGSGWVDLSSLVRNDLTYTTRSMNEDFHYAQNEALLHIAYDETYYEDFLDTSVDILVKIESGTPLVAEFTGHIPPSRRRRYDGLIDNVVIELEAIDYTDYLAKQIGDVAWENCKVQDPADTSHSLVHLVFTAIGLDTAYIDSSVTISTEVRVATSGADDEEALFFLDTLLYEYGYVAHWNGAGKFSPVRWILATGATTTYDFTESNIALSVEVEEEESEHYEGTDLIWFEVGERENTLIYRESLPFNDDGSFAGYDIPAGYYYPPETNVADPVTGTDQVVYQEYTDDAIRYFTNKAIVNNLDYNYKAFTSDFSDILKTSAHRLDWDAEAGITLDPDPATFENKRAIVRFLNGEASAKKIYYANIYATVLYRTTERKYRIERVASTKKLYGYASRFVFVAANAEALTQGIDKAFELSNTYYRFSSSDGLPRFGR